MERNWFRGNQVWVEKNWRSKEIIKSQVEQWKLSLININYTTINFHHLMTLKGNFLSLWISPSHSLESTIKLFLNEYRCQLTSDNLRLSFTAVALHEFKKNSMMLQPMLLSLEIKAIAMDNKLINWITFHRFEHGKAMDRKTFGLNKSSEDLLIYFRIVRKSCAYLVCKISLVLFLK